MATDKIHQENTGGRVQEVDQPGSDIEDWEFVHEYSYKYQSDGEKSVNEKSVSEKSVQDAVVNSITEGAIVDDKQTDGEITDQNEEDMTTDVDEKLAAKREKKREKRRAYKKRAQERRALEKEQEKAAVADAPQQNEPVSDQNQQKLAETLAEVNFAKKQIDDEIRSLQNAQKIAQNMVDKLNEEMTQKMSGLGITDKETDNKMQKEAFSDDLADLVTDWEEYFGEGELEDWQRLCHDLGLPRDLPSKTKCRKAIKTVHVNIRQFLDTTRYPGGVIFFKNVYKLAHWSRKSKKLIPKDLITRGHPMRALMRELSHCY